MSAAQPREGPSKTRSGAETLALLANPLNRILLRKLVEGPKRLVELRADGGFAPPTTVRAHLKGLELGGLAELQGREGSLRVLEWALTAAGTDLLDVVDTLETWLEGSPAGPLDPDGNAAKMAIKALVGGWSSTIMWALAAGPLSLGQLSHAIDDVTYPSLERRLSAMRLAGQLQVDQGSGSGTPYTVTTWLQEGITPLAAAVRWERSHRREETAPVTGVDAEAAFLLTLPLLRLSPTLKGACRMGIEKIEEERPLCGAVAQVAQGKVSSCTADVSGQVDAWSDGPVAGWAQAVTDKNAGGLEIGGDKKLARALVDGMRETLFEAASPAGRRSGAQAHS